MTTKEIKLFSELDKICMKLGVSYEMKVIMGIGVYFNVNISEKIQLRFGGFDKNMVGSFEEAIQGLLNAKLLNKQK